jgi:hypothetical protein
VIRLRISADYPLTRHANDEFRRYAWQIELFGHQRQVRVEGGRLVVEYLILTPPQRDQAVEAIRDLLTAPVMAGDIRIVQVEEV